jgi:ribosomal protein S18 acetylase RimI-like enzyme
MDKVLIRKLETRDAEGITRIYGSITQSPVNIDFKRVIEDLVKKADNACFVAELQGRVVGYMISYIVSGGFGIENSAWIAMLGVDPRLMGQDIGKNLAKETFQFYREKGIKDIYTSVRWDSTDLLSFFKTLGFDRSNFINLRRTLE